VERQWCDFSTVACQPPTSGLEPPLDRIHDARHFSRPQDRVDFGDLPAQLVPVALREAPGHHQPRALADALLLRHLEDRVDRLLLRVVDERTGVDDDDVRVRGVRRDFVSGLLGVSQHHLAVDEVFRAPERYETNFHGYIR
jgi:hypothetical protein